MQTTNDKKLKLLETMLTIRAFEEKAGELFQKNMIPGFIHLSIGQEASAAGTCSVLRTDDYLATTHRGHGHMIAKGADLRRMFAELFGRSTGYCRGKGGSMHIADFSTGFLGANGVVGGGFPLIVGAGLSIKLRNSDQVGVVFFGDGAANRGTFHEACNMAAVFKLPVVFVCENNRYASTTPADNTLAGGSVAGRACAYGIPGVSVDGNDVLAVWAAAAEAVARARDGKGPSILENRTYRYRGHYEGDPQKYRSKDEIQSAAETGDPIERFRRRLLSEDVLTEDLEKRLRKEIAARIEAAVQFGLEAPEPRPTEAFEDLYVNP